MKRHSSRLLAIATTTALAIAGVAATALSPVGASTHLKKFTGDPVKVATIGEFEVAQAGTSNPEVSGAIEARAKAINKAGGLKDASGKTHKVEVIVCNTNNDPNKAAQCMRDALAEGVVALVGNFTTYGSEIYPLLEQNKIPSIGPSPSEPISLQSDVSFPIVGGPVALLYYMPILLSENDADKISLVYPELAAAAQAVPVVQLSATAANTELVNKVAVPLDAADLAPQIAASTQNDANGIAAIVLGDAGAKYFVGLEQQGFDGKVATTSVFLTPQVLENAGDALKGTLVVNQATPASTKGVKGVKMFVKDMNAFDKNLDKSDGAVAAWAAMWVFERVAQTLPEITPAALLDAMGKVQGLDMGGLTPPLDTTTPFVVPEGFPLQIPRMFNPNGVLATVKDGKIVRTSKQFVNMFGQ